MTTSFTGSKENTGTITGTDFYKGTTITESDITHFTKEQQLLNQTLHDDSSNIHRETVGKRCCRQHSPLLRRAPQHLTLSLPPANTNQTWYNHRQRLDRYLDTRHPIATTADRAVTDHSGKSQSQDGRLPKLLLASSGLRVVHGSGWPMGWVKIFQFLVGWVECTIAKVLKVCKDYAFKAWLDKIWLHQAVKFDFYGRSDRYRKLIRRSSNNVSQWQLDNDVDLEVLVNCIGLGPKFSTCSGLGWVGSVSWWVGLDRVIQNGPMDNSVLPNQSQWSTFTVTGYAEAGHHKSPMTCCLLQRRIPKFLYAKPVPIKQ